MMRRSTGLAKTKARAFRLIALILAATSQTSCIVGPDYQKALLPLPAHWSGDKNTRPDKPPELAQWWKRLNDPLLDALIHEAVAGNLDVATAKARIREARASYRQAFGTLLPAMNGSGAASRNKSASSTAGASDGSYYNQYQLGFDASWELDLFGGNRRAAEAARYGMDASEEELRAILLTLVGDVASYYVEARGYQARISLTTRSAASQRETAALTRGKFEGGSSSGLDVANAEGQAASTEATIPDLRAAFAQAVHRLAVLTGQPPGSLNGRMNKPVRIPHPKLPIATGIPATVLLTRPDIRLAERQYAQYTAKIGQAEADRYPAISLTGNITTSATRLGDLGKTSTIGWSFGPTLSVPIFNGGQLQAAADVARAQRDQYFIAYRSSVLTALEDVENAIVLLGQEQIKNGKLASSVASYRQAATLARSLYQSGASSFLNVLDAERSLYTAENSLVASSVAITTDFIALNKALGGGWDGAIDTAKPEIVDVNAGLHFSQKSQFVASQE
jgi:outer membrane protein, multidrug efflux system